jgi:uncharacterized damage-inducible protein DinB
MTPDQASVILDFLLPQIEQEAQITRRVMAAVPEDKADYTPAEKCMTARELVTHMAAVDVWFLEGVVNGAFTQPGEDAMKEKPVAEMLALYDSQIPGLIKKLKDIPADALATPIQFYTFNLPRVAYLQFMQKHMIHHRGQLSAYLRPMGAKVPSIYGGSADEPMTTEASA